MLLLEKPRRLWLPDSPSLHTPSIIEYHDYLSFFWSLVVIADASLFSAMIAASASEASRGTSLTIVNSIGFAITIASIQFISSVSQNLNPNWVYLLLGIGPVIGLSALLKNKPSG